jgi:hypothetical protein
MSTLMTQNGVARDEPAAPPATSGLVSQTSVTNAFAIGWQMADLYAKAAIAGREATAPRDSNGDGGSPTLRTRKSWSAQDQLQLHIRQIQTEVAKLKACFYSFSAPQYLSAQLADFASKAESLLADTGDTASLRAGLDGAHNILQMALWAGDYRLGKAYGLGHTLAETCLHPADQASFDHAFSARLVDVEDTLADLASNFPAHASRAVSLSLRLWEQWAVNPKLNKQPLSWPNPGVRAALHRQGELWRAVLSGEKCGKDMLQSANYTAAFKALFRRTMRFGPMLWVLLGLIPLALAGGIYLLATQSGTIAKLGGAALSALAAVGISGSALKRQLSSIGAEFEGQLWQAELDWAIAEAITVPPGPWNVKFKNVDVPARGRDPRVEANTAALHRLRAGIGARKLAKVRELLHSTCEHRRDGDTLASTGDAVAGWLVEQHPLASKPKQLSAGRRPGTLFSEHGVDADAAESWWFVWTFRHGRVSQVFEYHDEPSARVAAWLPADKD